MGWSRGCVFIPTRADAGRVIPCKTKGCNKMTEVKMAGALRMAVSMVVIGLGSVATGQASEVDHYEGEPSETLEQAVENFTTYNAKLKSLLAREMLGMADIQEVHEYTYTLERALARMQTELDDLAVTLEEVHQSSEGEDAAALREVTRRYLEESAPLR
jgi:hypothetical protein